MGSTDISQRSNLNQGISTSQSSGKQNLLSVLNNNGWIKILYVNYNIFDSFVYSVFSPYFMNW